MKSISTVKKMADYIPEDLIPATIVNAGFGIGIGLLIFLVLETDLLYRNGYTM